MMECFKNFRDTTDSNDYISRDYVIPSIATFPAHLHGDSNWDLFWGKLVKLIMQIICHLAKLMHQYQIHWDSSSYHWDFLYLPSLDM